VGGEIQSPGVRSGRRGCCGSLEVAIASVKALTLDLDDCRDFDATTSRNAPKSRTWGMAPGLLYRAAC
jgi:hypothetical protein